MPRGEEKGRGEGEKYGVELDGAGVVTKKGGVWGVEIRRKCKEKKMGFGERIGGGFGSLVG